MMLRTLLSRIRQTFRRSRGEAEFDEELRAHLELLEQRFIAQGMDPVEARYAARRQFGGVTQIREHVRERRALLAIDVLARDLRHAFRGLGKAKGFTASAALTLALGIGAATAVFAVIDAVVLRPLPFPDPDRIAAFRSIDRRDGPQPSQLSYPDFFDFRRQNRVFEHLVSYHDGSFTLTDSQPAVQVSGVIASWDLFAMLGVQPELGRGFVPEEETPGTHAVVLSHGLWKRRFGGDKAILGRAVRINDLPYTVVGVAPAGMAFPNDGGAVELWTTLAEDTAVLNQRGARMLDAVGRLKPGISAAQAQAQMDLVAAARDRQYPENRNLASTLVVPELERLSGDSIRPLLILLGAVTMLLLIACANVANLLLARNAERGREFALRTALGASRPAIVRQMLIEGLALGLLGTAAGVLVALAVLRAALPAAGTIVPRLAQASIDGRVLAFSMALAVLTSVLFSLAPAFQASGAAPSGALKEGARSIARGQDRFRSSLVVLQITLGLVLLVGAEVLMAAFLHLFQLDPGFRPDHLLTFEVGLPESRYNVARQIAFSDRLLERLSSIPGVRAAAAGQPLPLTGHEMRAAFDIEGRVADPSDRPRSDAAIVTPGYFRALQIPLIRGRDFSRTDAAAAPPVALVNQAFARKYFPGEDAIGKRIQSAFGKAVMREIVGVVGDAKQAALGTDFDPICYLPYRQLPWSIGTVVLRTAAPPREIESAAQAAIASLDRQVPMHHVRTGQDLAAEALAAMQFLTALVTGFAAVALLLTGAGLYGVLSYAVARRRAEIGVRIALGAGRKEVLALVLRQAMRLVGTGLLFGLLIAAAGGRLLATQIAGLRSADPLLLAAACAVLAITGLAAAYVPAARAASVDPMQALRSE